MTGAGANPADPPGDLELTARFDLLPALRERTAVVPLTGGITNRNFRIVTPQGTYVARVSSPDSTLLAIDRAVEHSNSQAAAASGAAPNVVDYSAAAGILVVQFVVGRTFGDDDIRDPAQLPRIATACKTLHSGPAFMNEFNMFRIQERYLQVILERGLRLPAGYQSYAGQVATMEQVLLQNPCPLVPCNNDLLAANMIDDGPRLWLIDYEYSGNNDACFELGNIWSEANLPLPLLDELVTAYHGTPSPRLVARSRLWALMSKYGWTLWACIQDGTSTIDFDFWSWGMQKYERAMLEFESPQFAELLRQASA